MRHLLGAIALLSVLVGGVAYFVYNNQKLQPGGIEAAPGFVHKTPGAPLTKTSVTSTSEKIYRSKQYGFSLQHPSALEVSETDEGNGATTIVFQSKDGAHGFQLFITPYPHTVVTRERFFQDQPTGVIQQQAPTLVAGAPATMFQSTHPLVGNTFEVWFIQNGYLYEATTHAADERWLKDILATWQFI